jgi:hypothetical protein
MTDRLPAMTDGLPAMTDGLDYDGRAPDYDRRTPDNDGRASGYDGRLPTKTDGFPGMPDELPVKTDDFPSMDASDRWTTVHHRRIRLLKTNSDCVRRNCVQQTNVTADKMKTLQQIISYSALVVKLTKVT